MILAMPLSAQWLPLHSQAFEDSAASWTHSNGQPFPYGWGRQASGLHPGWAPPNAGGWCLWIDSDATGQAGTADTAFSPAVPGDSCDPVKIRWGIGYDDYYSGADFMRMLYRINTGGIWQSWAIGKSYTADAVRDDSVMIAQQVESLQVAFYYSDGGTWAGWAAVDNVEVSGFVTGVAGEPGPSAGPAVGLTVSCRPNPARDRVVFSFRLPGACPYEIRVYDISGHLAAVVGGAGENGLNQTVLWTGGLSPGVYLYRVASWEGSAAGRMAVLR